MPAALRPALGGLAYFALVFLVGTGLGIARTLVVAPRLGAVAATLIELPLLLGASWFVCARVVVRLAVPTDTASRILMGGLAFAFLMAAELAVTLFVLSGTVDGYFSAYRNPAPLMGLAGQLAFATIPFLMARPRP